MATNAIALSVLGLLVGMGASAQPGGGTIKISPSILVAGGTATISITGGTPGATYQITITGDTGQTETREVQLDANGDGEFQWSVRPDWIGVAFELPDGTSDAAPIVQP